MSSTAYTLPLPGPSTTEAWTLSSTGDWARTRPPT